MVGSSFEERERERNCIVCRVVREELCVSKELRELKEVREVREVSKRERERESE